MSLRWQKKQPCFEVRYTWTYMKPRAINYSVLHKHMKISKEIPTHFWGISSLVNKLQTLVFSSRLHLMKGIFFSGRSSNGLNIWATLSYRKYVLSYPKVVSNLFNHLYAIENYALERNSKGKRNNIALVKSFITINQIGLLIQICILYFLQ